MQSGEWIMINDRYYRLGAVLSSGTGSYGQVWAATDAAGRAVAVKLINAEAMTQTDPALQGHWRAHLEREIAFLKGLTADQSRHVVVLLNHGEVDGQPVLVLERLQTNLGQWLAQLRREGRSPDLAQILDWAEQILDGLDVVHQAGFVYRDLKFSNLLVGDNGAWLKLADFGSLKREDGDNTRSFIGTPATMAPEQVLPAHRGSEGCEYAVDYRADYYALGLLLFSLLADQPTTAAQRRLGQLLALHGQEGAGQYDVDLGGLDDEERESLQRSIELKSTSAWSEQGDDLAAPLVNLIAQLLARNLADRPTDSLEIRAVLDAARVRPVAMPTLTPDWNAPPPADEPPNRHPRRIVRPTPRSWQRWALLAGTVGLAGAVAWAIVRPVGEIGPDPAEPLSAVIAPPTTEIAKPAEPTAPEVEPAMPPPPSEVSTVASPEPPETTDAPVAETPEPVHDVPVAQTPEPLDDMPVAQTPEPVGAAPVAETPEPVDDMPVAQTPEPLDATPPPVRFIPAEPRPAAEPRPKSRSPAVVATPHPSATTTVKPRSPARAEPPANPKPTRPAPASAVAADRPAAVERPNAGARSAPVEGSAVVDRLPAAPATVPQIAKPTPPPSAPAKAKPAQRSPTSVQTKPAPRESGSSKSVARVKPAPSVASRPPAVPKSASKPTSPVVPAERPNRVASRPKPAPALPPIKLESRPKPAPALPPIKLESRPQSAPPAPPPIELVSRSSAAATTARRAPTVARTEPKPNKPSSYSSAPTTARSTDPITQFGNDANRAAAAVGDWASRTSATVSKEVRRGLEAADQTVKQWTGRCNQVDSCGRNTTQVQRRDRWADRYGRTVSQRQHPARPDEDEGFAQPPPHQYRDDYR